MTTDRGGGTARPSGTSFSAPIVAGVAGLVISHARDRGFVLTNDDVRNILEITANGNVGPLPGFDIETGHGIVDSGAALSLIDVPNTLVQGESVGGTSALHQALSQWVVTSGRWGIAAGTYFQVDRYKVTKHISFAVPFCSPPLVWMRDRQTRTLGYANPNNGRPFSIITNITQEGFDVEYVTYYVRFNASGQTLNTWVPNHPSQTRFAYTAVGEQNPAGFAGPISGQDIICTTSAYTLQNLPSGMGVTWSASPSGIVSISGSGQTITLNPVSNGYISLSASITGGCQVPPTITKNIQIGPVNSSQTSVLGTSGVCPGNQYTYQAVVPGGHKPGFTYDWAYPPGWNVNNQSANQIALQVPSFSPNYGTVRFRVNNGCGFSDYSGITVFPGFGCGSFPYSVKVYPNPASDDFQLEIGERGQTLSFDLESQQGSFEIEILDQSGNRLYSSVTAEMKTYIDVSKLIPGFYYLHIQYKGALTKRQFKIER